MTADIEDRVRDAYGDVTPADETEREVLAEIARTVRVAPARRRWEVPVGIAAAAVLLAALLWFVPGPEQPGEPRAASPGVSAATAAIATATSEDGRFRLEITQVEVAPPEPGSTLDPAVELRGRVIAEGPRIVVGPDLAVRCVTTPDGLDRTPEGLGHRTPILAPAGEFAFEAIRIGPAPEEIALLELETTMLRVRDRNIRLEGIRPGEDGRKVLPPYTLQVAANPESVSISATYGSGRRAIELATDVWPANRTVASSARIVDAEGRLLERRVNTRLARRLDVVSYSRDVDSGPIAYPVTITIPDPTPVERIPAIFRIRDLELPPVRDREISFSAWGEASRGLSLRAALPPVVEQGETLPAGVEWRREESGLPDGVTWLETRFVRESLTLRLAPAGGGPETVLRPISDGSSPVPPPRSGGGAGSLEGGVLAIRARFALPLEGDALPPGRYDGVVEYRMQAPWYSTPIREGEGGFIWRGKLVTGRFTLEIVAEPERTRTLRLPTRLRLGKGLALVYDPADSEPLIVKLRNGYRLGAHLVREGPGEESPPEVLGPRLPEPGEPLEILPAVFRGPCRCRLTLTIIRDRGQVGPWSMNIGSVREGAEVLWKRTFDLSFTAGEIEANR